MTEERKRPPWEVELSGDERCSEKGCGRPADRGYESIRGVRYVCAPHDEIHLMQGQLDWLEGEMSFIEDWHKEAKTQADNGVLDPRVLVLADPHNDGNEPSGWPLYFESLRAAVGVAVKLTEKEVAHKEAALREN